MFCVGYAVTAGPRAGRLDAGRLRAMGVPGGPLFGALKSGKTVQLPDGREVRPEDVVGPPQPGRCAMSYLVAGLWLC